MRVYFTRPASMGPRTRTGTGEGGEVQHHLRRTRGARVSAAARDDAHLRQQRREGWFAFAQRLQVREDGSVHPGESRPQPDPGRGFTSSRLLAGACRPRLLQRDAGDDGQIDLRAARTDLEQVPVPVDQHGDRLPPCLGEHEGSGLAPVDNQPEGGREELLHPGPAHEGARLEPLLDLRAGDRGPVLDRRQARDPQGFLAGERRVARQDDCPDREQRERRVAREEKRRDAGHQGDEHDPRGPGEPPRAFPRFGSPPRAACASPAAPGFLHGRDVRHRASGRGSRAART